MPYKDKEKQREHDKQYREANREKINNRMKQYYIDNKEVRNNYNRQYQEAHKEQQRQYNRTPGRKKIMRISNWKKYGVKLPDDYPDWSLFYDEEYVKTTKCEECFVELTEADRLTPTTKVLDHCHTTGDFRNILCHACNIKRK
tara:strand:- start:39 stop:467 length:429 start_codon:yes stop_codon:yes gene_type:complete